MKLRQNPVPAHMRSPCKQDAVLIEESAPSPSISSLSAAEWTLEARALIDQLKHLITPTDAFELYVKKKILFISENGCIALYARNGYGAPYTFQPLANGGAGLNMLDRLAQRGPGYKMDWNWTEFEFQEVFTSLPPKINPTESNPPTANSPKTIPAKQKTNGSIIDFVSPTVACRVTPRKQPSRKKAQN